MAGGALERGTTIRCASKTHSVGLFLSCRSGSALARLDAPAEYDANQKVASQGRREANEERDGRAGSDQGAHGVQRVPSFHQCSCLRPGLARRRPHESRVHRFDHQQGPWPIRQEDETAEQQSESVSLPPSENAEEKTDDSEGGLHFVARFIGGLPFGEHGSIIEAQPGRVFCDVDVKRSTREQSRDGETKQTGEHLWYPAPTFPADEIGTACAADPDG